jgi:Domain of unknown function (DUF4440)
MGDISTEQLHDELSRLYEEWFRGIPAHDTSFFERVLADDWYYVNVLGEVRGKRQYLDYIAPVPADAPPNRLVELTIRPHDAVVVVHGLYVISTASRDGSDTRFTAIWSRRDGQLVALAHHATTVAGGS